MLSYCFAYCVVKPKCAELKQNEQLVTVYLYKKGRGYQSLFLDAMFVLLIIYLIMSFRFRLIRSLIRNNEATLPCAIRAMPDPVSCQASRVGQGNGVTRLVFFLHLTRP